MALQCANIKAKGSRKMQSATNQLYTISVCVCQAMITVMSRKAPEKGHQVLRLKQLIMCNGTQFRDGLVCNIRHGTLQGTNPEQRTVKCVCISTVHIILF